MAEKLIVYGGASYVCVLWVYLWVMCAVFWGLGRNISEEADPATDYIR